MSIARLLLLSYASYIIKSVLKLWRTRKDDQNRSPSSVEKAENSENVRDEYVIAISVVEL